MNKSFEQYAYGIAFKERRKFYKTNHYFTIHNHNTLHTISFLTTK